MNERQAAWQQRQQERERRRAQPRAESAKRSQGAEFSFFDYLQLHRNTAREALHRLFQAPVNLVMTWLVIAIALALPTAFYISLSNVQQLSANFDGAPQLSIFLKTNISSTEQQKLLQAVRDEDELSEVKYTSPAKALEQFQQDTGMARIVDSLDKNPLPPLISAKLTDLDPLALGTLQARLEKLPGVQLVQLDMAWVQRLHQILTLGERITWSVGALLALGVLLVVGNTTRMAIDNRREEILVVKLVGGSDAYVRRPFLYTGLWFGLGGGILAWLLVTVLTFLLNGPVSALSTLYYSQFRLHGLGFGDTVLLLMLSAILGWVGAWISSSHHIRAIEPR